MDKEIKEKTEKYLSEHPDQWDDIRRSLDIHKKRREEHPDDLLYKHFEWEDVRVSGRRMKNWILAGFLEYGYKSSKTKRYNFVNIDATDEALKEFKKLEEIKDQPQEINMEIPDDIFSSIYGMNDIKKIMNMALKADDQVHVCLWGPPATAKSLFLMEISKLEGSYFTIGSSASKSGLTEVLIQNRPSILLIDEIDKLAKHPEELSVLLSLMETGLVKSTKHGKHDSVILNTKVFAAGNWKNLPRELSSRFLEFHLQEYNEHDFEEILKYYLVHAENTDEDIANYVAERTYKISKDVRTARNIVRMAKSKEEIDIMITMIKKYGDKNEY